MSSTDSGFVHGRVRQLLRLEGLAVLLAAAYVYLWLQAGWGRFALFFFLPDLAFLAYLLNSRVGALAYNALHSYLAPILLGLLAHRSLDPQLMPLAIIWFAHIGFDRALGYGLKYSTAFENTHLGRIGRQKS